MCTTTSEASVCFGCGCTIPHGAVICGDPMCELEYEDAQLRDERTLMDTLTCSVCLTDVGEDQVCHNPACYTNSTAAL